MYNRNRSGGGLGGIVSGISTFISNIIHSAVGIRGLIFWLILFVAMIVFEFWNYASSEYALVDYFGQASFANIKWATLLALAFCAVDFAGLARIFTPEEGDQEPNAVWWLAAAWLLAALFDTFLTWWSAEVASTARGPSMLAMKFPTIGSKLSIGIAVIDLTIRVLLVNAFATSGDRLLNAGRGRSSQSSPSRRPEYRPAPEPLTPATPKKQSSTTFKPTPAASTRPLYTEPTYHPVGMDAQESDNPNRPTSHTLR